MIAFFDVSADKLLTGVTKPRLPERTVALAVHAWLAFFRRPVTEDEIARELEQLGDAS